MHHMFTKHQRFRGALRLTLVAAFGVSIAYAMNVEITRTQKGQAGEKLQRLELQYDPTLSEEASDTPNSRYIKDTKIVSAENYHACCAEQMWVELGGDRNPQPRLKFDYCELNLMDSTLRKFRNFRGKIEVGIEGEYENALIARFTLKRPREGLTTVSFYDVRFLHLDHNGRVHEGAISIPSGPRRVSNEAMVLMHIKSTNKTGWPNPSYEEMADYKPTKQDRMFSAACTAMYRKMSKSYSALENQIREFLPKKQKFKLSYYVGVDTGSEEDSEEEVEADDTYTFEATGDWKTNCKDAVEVCHDNGVRFYYAKMDANDYERYKETMRKHEGNVRKLSKSNKNNRFAFEVDERIQGKWYDNDNPNAGFFRFEGRMLRKGMKLHIEHEKWGVKEVTLRESPMKRPQFRREDEETQNQWLCSMVVTKEESEAIGSTEFADFFTVHAGPKDFIEYERSICCDQIDLVID